MVSLRLIKPEPTTDQLRLRAASGASGVSRKAQQALQARVHEQLRKELGR